MLHLLHLRLRHFLFTPSHQPWLSITLRFLRYPYALIRDVLQGQLTLRAMSLVYTTLLSIAPLMALAFSVLKGLGYSQILQPLLYRFLQPIGDQKAAELSNNMMSSINSVRGGVLGSLGLAILIYTVISTIQKVEESFNFVWRVEQPRSFARRFGDYLSVMIVGPVLMAAAIGVFTAVSKSDAAQSFTHLGSIAWLLSAFTHVTPFLLISIAFSFAYGFIPNTKVRIKSALIGGFTAGALWTAGGALFTHYVASSAQTMVIYAGFAIIILALIWAYVSWLILLVGAQLSFYIQHPQSLRAGHRDMQITPAFQERVGLSIMYLIAYDFKNSTRRWTLSKLSRNLELSLAALRPIVNALLNADLLVVTEEDAYIPARDLSQIQLHQILEAVRNEAADPRAPMLRTIAAADEIAAQINGLLRSGLQGKTLADWVTTDPLLQIDTHRKNRDVIPLSSS
ncbi:MAG TPA: YihY/virulence factor BrkB family protein [Steroidobacteraceae bacterium]|nr:YihY/virulence factor BrkB family protein [Steroidobacteraceae bacterium]